MKTTGLIGMAVLMAGCHSAPQIAGERGDFFVTEHTRDTLTVAECLGRYLVETGNTNAGQISEIQVLPGAKRVSFQRTSNTLESAGEVVVKPTSHATRAEWRVGAGFPSGNVQAEMKRLRPPC